MDDSLLAALEQSIDRLADRCRALGELNERLVRENDGLRRERDEVGARIDRILARLEEV